MRVADGMHYPIEGMLYGEYNEDEMAIGIWFLNPGGEPQLIMNISVFKNNWILQGRNSTGEFSVSVAYSAFFNTRWDEFIEFSDAVYDPVAFVEVMPRFIRSLFRRTVPSEFKLLSKGFYYEGTGLHHAKCEGKVQQPSVGGNPYGRYTLYCGGCGAKFHGEDINEWADESLFAPRPLKKQAAHKEE